jgi:hypothetical protein
MPTHTAPAAPQSWGAPQDASTTGQRTSLRPGLRLAGLAGTASLVLGWIGMSMVEPDGFGLTPNSSAQTVIEVFTEHANALHAGESLLAAAAVLALLFVGAVWSLLKPYGEWPAVVAAAGAATLSLLWLGSAAQLIAFDSFEEYSDGEAARMLLTAGWDTGTLFLVPFLVMALAAAFASLPTMVRAVAVVVAGCCAIGLLPGSDFGYAAMWLATGWFVPASVALALAPGRHVT